MSNEDDIDFDNEDGYIKTQKPNKPFKIGMEDLKIIYENPENYAMLMNSYNFMQVIIN